MAVSTQHDSNKLQVKNVKIQPLMTSKQQQSAILHA